MWLPSSAEEIEQAARDGRLVETSSFDGKADLPDRGRNADLAIDVAAMTTDGGTLLYGVREDDNDRLTLPEPIDLSGAAERIDQIVSTSISEVPYIEVREFPASQDASRGYIVIVIPQSARAPHQVIVGGDLRYYGRGATGNRRLTEGEIARLYQRRQEWEQDRGGLLVQAIQQAPFEPQSDLAYLHGFARPVAPDSALWDRAVAAAGGRRELQQALAEAAAGTRPHDGYSPNLKSGVYWDQRGADEWRMSSTTDLDYTEPGSARYVVNVRINIDGRGHLFCGRAGERINPRANAPDETGPMVIFESIVAGNLAAFLVIQGTLYRLAGYHGHVDVGMVATGLRGGLSSTLGSRFMIEGYAYNADTYPRTDRVSAAEMNEADALARRMVQRLVTTTTGRDDFDPFGS